MKTWFITEASQGLGHECALAALERGDLVAASAADATALNQLSGQHGTALLPVEMDVTDRRSVFDAIAAAHRHFGRLDIIANTAEYRQLGCVEEVTEKQVRDQMEINFLGALWLTQAALPYLRAQRRGHIVQLTSPENVGALVGIYSASKWAIEGFCEALSHEFAPFGIHVTMATQDPLQAQWISLAKHATMLPAYARTHLIAAGITAQSDSVPADLSSMAAEVLDVVDADEPPLRVVIGNNAGLADRGYRPADDTPDPAIAVHVTGDTLSLVYR